MNDLKYVVQFCVNQTNLGVFTIGNGTLAEVQDFLSQHFEKAGSLENGFERWTQRYGTKIDLVIGEHEFVRRREIQAYLHPVQSEGNISIVPSNASLATT